MTKIDPVSLFTWLVILSLSIFFWIVLVRLGLALYVLIAMLISIFLITKRKE